MRENESNSKNADGVIASERESSLAVQDVAMQGMTDPRTKLPTGVL